MLTTQCSREHERERASARAKTTAARATPGAVEPAHSAPRSRDAEQPLRPDQQDHDQHHEEGQRRPDRARSRPRPPTRRRPAISDADDRAAEAAEPAEHDDRQQPRDQVVVAAGVERVDASRTRRRPPRPSRRRARSRAPTPARASTPSSRADVGFCTVARTARPKRRALQQQVRAAEQDRPADDARTPRHPHDGDLVADDASTLSSRSSVMVER